MSERIMSNKLFTKNKIHNTHNSICKYACIVLVRFSHLDYWFFLQKWKITHKKIPIPDMRNYLLGCYPGLSKSLPKHTAYCYYPWISPRGRKQILIAEDTTHFRSSDQSPLSWDWSLCSLCENQLSWYQKALCKFPEEGIINSPTQFINHTNG